MSDAGVPLAPLAVLIGLALALVGLGHILQHIGRNA